MSRRLQHVLKAAESRRVKLTLHMHDELNLWCHFIESLAEQPTHLKQIGMCPPTWTEETYASLNGIGIICCSSSGQHFLYRLPVRRTKSQRLLSDDNIDGDLTITDLDLESYVTYLPIFVPLMEPLEHIYTKVDNTSADIWARRDSVSSFNTVGPLLR